MKAKLNLKIIIKIADDQANFCMWTGESVWTNGFSKKLISDGKEHDPCTAGKLRNLPMA